MNHNINHYTLLADVFEYPACDYLQKVAAAQQFLDLHYPEASELLQPFTDNMAMMDTLQHQELFVRSFDVQALTTLDLGYVLFGDDYKRGELLVNLNREHREVQNDCGTELSDYLANVLRLLPKMSDKSLLHELVEKIISPALSRMIRTFEPDQVAMKDKFDEGKYKTIIERPIVDYTIFRRSLKALQSVLRHDFEIIEKEPEEKTSDFLQNIRNEVKLEG
ncbi:MAG: hypothetical protein OEQ53_08730 [Saprospiraceae bacterium]|nr:hypothetical protein [Saprospiraceae bacterium]